MDLFSTKALFQNIIETIFVYNVFKMNDVFCLIVMFIPDMRFTDIKYIQYVHIWALSHTIIRPHPVQVV